MGLEKEIEIGDSVAVTACESIENAPLITDQGHVF
jgi:hypothetical protein